MDRFRLWLALQAGYLSAMVIFRAYTALTAPDEMVPMDKNRAFEVCDPKLVHGKVLFVDRFRVKQVSMPVFLSNMDTIRVEIAQPTT